MINPSESLISSDSISVHTTLSALLLQPLLSGSQSAFSFQTNTAQLTIFPTALCGRSREAKVASSPSTESETSPAVNFVPSRQVFSSVLSQGDNNQHLTYFAEFLIPPQQTKYFLSFSQAGTMDDRQAKEDQAREGSATQDAKIFPAMIVDKNDASSVGNSRVMRESSPMDFIEYGMDATLPKSCRQAGMEVNPESGNAGSDLSPRLTNKQPAISYERRARHKTRRDLYELKNTATQQSNTKTQVLGFERKRKRTGSLLDDFTSDKITNKRISVSAIVDEFYLDPTNDRLLCSLSLRMVPEYSKMVGRPHRSRDREVRKSP